MAELGSTIIATRWSQDVTFVVNKDEVLWFGLTPEDAMGQREKGFISINCQHNAEMVVASFIELFVMCNSVSEGKLLSQFLLLFSNFFVDLEKTRTLANFISPELQSFVLNLYWSMLLTFVFWCGFDWSFGLLDGLCHI